MQRSRALSKGWSVGRAPSALTTKSGAPLAVALSISSWVVVGNSARETYLPMSARSSRRAGSESDAAVASCGRSAGVVSSGRGGVGRHGFRWS